jgi:hypothetical protein
MRLTILLVTLISTAYSADFTTYVGGTNQSPYTIGGLAKLRTLRAIPT